MPITGWQAEPHRRSGLHGRLLKTFLLGPMRALVPALLNVLLMPVIVSKGGLNSVGLWGICNLFVGVFLLGDFGVSQYVSRSLSAGHRSGLEVRTEVEMVVGFWAGMTAAVILAALIFAKPLLASQDIAVAPASLAALVLLPLVGMAALACGVFTFMHVSAHQLHFAQMNQVVSAATQFVVAACLLQLVPPYMALVAALASGYAVQVLGLYWNLRRVGFNAAPRAARLPSFYFLANLFDQTKGFALLAAAQQLFHVANRFAVLIFGGTAVLGAFEIASRIPFVLEQAFSNGLQPLFAIFAETNWQDEAARAEVHRLVQWVYRLLVVTSIGCLAAWIALSGPFIGLWLNIANPNLLFATQLFGLFNAVRVFNTPIFWALQARGGETLIGTIYATQAVLLLLILFILNTFMAVTFPVIAIVITALSVGAELMVMATAQRRIGFMSVVIGSWGDIVPFVAAVALLTSGWLAAAPPMHRAGALASGLVHAVMLAPLWCCILFVLSSGSPWKLFRYSV